MYPKSFFYNCTIRQKPGKCFVIMPFANNFDEIFDTIKEAIMGPELSLTCSRADDLQGGGHIIEDILHQIAESEIVIADLTGRNPNVFYELGIVQMVKEVDKVILLCQDSESIPFDVRVFRCIIYQQSISGARELKKKLISNIKEAADTSFRFTLEQDGSYIFQQKVMGQDNCAYDFSISKCIFAIGGAKFVLKVNRYVAGRPSAVVFNQGCGLAIGEKEQLYNTEWDIVLESVIDDRATFVVQRHEEQKNAPLRRNKRIE